MKTLRELAIEHDTSAGGKAYNLGLLDQAGLHVPEGIVLSSLPGDGDAEWSKIADWWSSIGCPKLAARSSAQGEDAKDASFAGQLKSVLEIKTMSELKEAAATCFASRDQASSQAYREHFNQKLAGMNVLIQRMIEPAFSGVFFTRDPRSTATNGSASWLIEAVEGLGEQLVSGHVTPFQIRQDGTRSGQPSAWREEYTREVATNAERARQTLGFDVDMEWAIDRDGQFWALQARPITTLINEADLDTWVGDELARLKQTHESNTIWDGQTFVEWTGLPSPLAFSIWELAFAPGGAFRRALRVMGYEGGASLQESPESLLERIYGRACLNLERLQPLFFGRIPYTMVADPHPHLDFAWRKIDVPTILHAPSAIFRMATVAWNLQSHKDKWISNCRKELEDLRRTGIDCGHDTNGWRLADLSYRFVRQSEVFARETLLWPFVLAVLAESTTDTLELTLAKDLGPQKGKALLRDWMSKGITTATAEMEKAYEAACEQPSLRSAFLSSYGHRGPGELDLAHPRWSEMGEKAFRPQQSHSASKSAHTSVEEDTLRLVHAIRRPLVTQEWNHLKEILELREALKMETMRQYAELRRTAGAIGASTGLNDDVFFLTLGEIESLKDDSVVQEMQPVIDKRKSEMKRFSKIALPVSFSLAQLEDVLRGRESKAASSVMNGEPLSSGLAFGEVRVVRDLNDADVSTWPQNTILVAEATDPGWTPLFSRACGIVVEKGGVLSHCAIVAREMGVPAVSRIDGCTRNLKDGDYVWVDGDLGRVTLTPKPATGD